MKPIIEMRKLNSSYVIFETRTHILEDWIIFDKDHTGARIIVRAVEDSDTEFYLDMSIMDDDDYDHTVVFNCHNYIDFSQKLRLLVEWLNDIRGCYIFYDELLQSIPIYADVVE